MDTQIKSRTYLYEFPNYDDVLPDLPEGWEDNSWHNDVCPSMDYDLGEERILRVWMDYKNPEFREIGGTRYAVAIGEYGSLEVLLETDSFQEAMDYINTNNLTKESNK